MNDVSKAITILEGSFALLEQLEGMNIDVSRLQALRAHAKAEGRDISAAEIKALADEATTALGELDTALKARGA